VFGLGVLLYECMVGKLPFDGKNPAQVLRRVLEGAFTPSERARPTIGSGLGAVVDKALAKEAKDRYASTLEVAEALKAELKLLGFDDPPNEIGAFLQDPKGYRPAFEERIVGALVARGRKARQERDVPTATSSFNRALAYRPDDADLIAEVSSLAQRERFRRGLVQLLVILTGSLIIAAVLGGVFRLVAKLRGTDQRKPAASAAAANKAKGPVQMPQARPGDSAEPTTKPKKKQKVKAQLEAPKEPPVATTRSVQVVVVGPQNATVVIDGETFANWFGALHDLEVGPHSFVFKPPSEECCEQPPPMVVDIRPADASGKPQVVQGTIKWKPATLEFKGGALSTASCPEVGVSFSRSGEQHQVNMTKARQKLLCTVNPFGEPPIQVDVDITPGRISTFPRN
jgi:serine/threonine-protein kinase